MAPCCAGRRSLASRGAVELPNRFLRELQASARSPFLGRQGGRSKRLLWAKSKYSSRLGSITPNAALHFYNQLRSNLLRDLMLVEVLPSWRYRYRLIGTANAKAAWHERHRSVSRRGTAWPGIQSACPRPLRRVRSRSPASLFRMPVHL